MNTELTELILSEWSGEIRNSLFESKAIYLALFAADGTLIFANDAMAALFKDEPCRNLINPTFERLTGSGSDSAIIYQGFLTIGDYESVNISMYARVYRKQDKILIIGDFDAIQLTEQNKLMHHLNQEVNNLQRQLIKKKHQLESTLKDLNEANIKLKELNATKDKFFSIIAHDLRNPFNSICGFSELLLDDLAEKNYETTEEYVEIIRDSSKHAMTLLTNLLEWARSQTGRMKFNPELFDITDVVNDAVTLAGDYARQKSISILKELPVPVVIFADKAMLETILRNLISNAVKFTGNGGTIIISVTPEDENKICVTVADNGVGISKENLDKLFKIEENHSTVGTQKEKGTGLGLILCKEFIEKHGGTIWVESEQRKGSKFIFTLPVNRQEKG